jgi:hypothetical protein
MPGSFISKLMRVREHLHEAHRASGRCLQVIKEAGDKEITYLERCWGAQEGGKTTTTNVHYGLDVLHAPSSTTTITPMVHANNANIYKTSH